MKRLVIKSKPIKFHLIDANRVIAAKKRKVIPHVVSSDKLLAEKYYSSEDDDDSDIEIEPSRENISRYPYKINGDNSSSKAIVGESVQTPPPLTNENNLGKETNGYWCTPSIKELTSKTIDELKVIENFIVGRVGFGQVAYNFPVDLSEIAIRAKANNISIEDQLFERTISIKHKFLLVYVNEEEKPPLGMGLNVPATVTLEGVGPSDKSVSASDHIKYLQSRTGMEYVTYDPITHVWVFKVKHFSVWGLVEEADEADDPDFLIGMKRRQDLLEEQHELEYSRLYSNEAYLKEIKKQKVEIETRDLPGNWTSSNDKPLNIKRGLVAKEIEQQINSYNNLETENVLSQHVNDISIEDNYESDDSLDNVSEESVRSEIQKVDYLKQLVSYLPRDTNFNEIVEEKAYEPEISNDDIFNTIQTRPNLPVSEDWLVQLELANDLNSCLTPFAASPKSNKGKVSINTVDELLFADFNKSLLDKDSVSTPNTYESKVKNIESFDESFNAYVRYIISNLLAQSPVSQRSNGFPVVQTNGSITFGAFAKAGAEEMLLSLSSTLFDTQTNQTSNLMGENPQMISHVSELYKKKAFGIWLKSFNSKSIQLLLDQNKSEPLELVFSYICSGDIKAACETAISSNNSHLAAILTLADSNDSYVQQAALAQVDTWIENNSIEYIPQPIVKIYKILSGKFDDVIETLPWNISLAINLFYGKSSLTLEDIINNTVDGIDIQSLGESVAVIDALKLFYLLQTQKKEVVLKRIRNTSLSKTMKWLYYKLISSNTRGSDFDELTYDLGNLLHQRGLWKQSLYVYSHLSDDEKAKDAIRNVIIQNTNSIKGPDYDEETYLVNTLKIPHRLIYEAIGIKNHTEKKYWEECEAYTVAQLWENAHNTIVKELGPSTVISNNQDLINNFLALLSKFPESGLIIPDWNRGAGIYYKYFEVLKNPNSITDLVFLLANIPRAIESSTFLSKAALKIISKKVGDLAINHSNSIDGIQQKVQSLVLGSSDRKYFDIRLQSISA
ncbi:nuclear protein 96-domain-containing protein [Scheffersomyces amazonensis]|uniref:nuclear protein 96-domain-containing protein n=1 Tax=Scheffersomyces amazonensis TaxID=1078765 RepID=UPI00315CBE8E